MMVMTKTKAAEFVLAPSWVSRNIVKLKVDPSASKTNEMTTTESLGDVPLGNLGLVFIGEDRNVSL